MSMNIYALVDACNAPGFLEMLNTYDPPASCLYNEPLQPGMAERAPYIVTLTDPVKAWLAKLTTPWGLYLITEVNFLEMRKHLRRYTFAMIPISEKPVFFRFYDPRVFWDLANILDDWQLHAFLGPIEIVASYYDGQYRQDHFEAQREQFPNQIRMKTQYITLSEDQYAKLNQVYEERYIDELADHMMKYVDPNLIEDAKNNADQIHREMLKHARDVQGEEILHAADHDLLLATSDTSSHQKPIRIEQSYFSFSRKTGEWHKIRGNETSKVGFLMSQALTKIAKTPISEHDFHEQTNFEYIYLTNKQETQTKNQNIPHRNEPDYLKAYNGQPYFYEQNSQWFYVDDAGYAHPIRDERTQALNQTKQQKVFEDDFHQRTNNRYQHYEGLAYLPEITEEEDTLEEITTMDELKATIHQFAQDLISFTAKQGISDNRSIKALAKLFMRNNFLRMKDIPEKWLDQLIDKHNDETGQYRVRMFISQAVKDMVKYRK